MLRTEAAARYTGLSVSTLEKLRIAGGGPIYCQPTRAVLYDPDDLDRWLASHRRSSTSVRIGASHDRVGENKEGDDA
ncbi:helix-turn-helix domain-containing protein [Mesorhizobium sp. B1-1-5]|uniref:helix-turn-helix transcriptional regulator n=1 Tax=Mesorhizobium sp. B1-1-5 TaxID=2589979 RepID=UPI0015E35FA0|nr:helix-turn-helix domain-containing protein [Mesorhizobium sp. B1-1-5]